MPAFVRDTCDDVEFQQVLQLTKRVSGFNSSQVPENRGPPSFGLKSVENIGFLALQSLCGFGFDSVVHVVMNSDVGEDFRHKHFSGDSPAGEASVEIRIAPQSHA